MNKQPARKGINFWVCAIVVVLILLLSICISGCGSESSSGKRTCAWCNGTGYSGNGATNAVEYVMNKTPCKHCNGTGYIG